MRVPRNYMTETLKIEYFILTLKTNYTVFVQASTQFSLFDCYLTDCLKKMKDHTLFFSTDN